jgi:UDP-N-acetylglucosamine 2-epimerase (non-hydrolysing)
MSKPEPKKIMSVVGARPNFMKIAPLDRELRAYEGFRHIIIHTGQHYDKEMSDVFFEQLGLPKPDRSLGVGSGGHGEMTGKIMIEFEKVCEEMKPDLVVVVGDVNSTIATALVARKLGVPVAHVEAGLRSFDETMPEELNRHLTDCISNLLFVSEPSGVRNLEREGTDMTRVHLVGDIMLETLQMFLPAIRRMECRQHYGLPRGRYALVTIHRPSNADDPAALAEVIDVLKTIPYPILFPIHPRTQKRLDDFGLRTEIETVPNLTLLPPQPYMDFLSLLEGCAVILSDSGSVQAEASFFGVPCLVCRENTERPIYLEEGTSTLVGRDKGKIRGLLGTIRKGAYRKANESVKDLGIDVGGKCVRIMTEYLRCRQ